MYLDQTLAPDRSAQGNRACSPVWAQVLPQPKPKPKPKPFDKLSIVDELRSIRLKTYELLLSNLNQFTWFVFGSKLPDPVHRPT